MRHEGDMTASEDVVATALRSVIADCGWNAAQQPARLLGALNDQLAASAADHRASVDALVVASEEGVAARLRTAPAEDPAAARQHVRALVDWGLSEGTAEWVVGTWSAVVPPTSLSDQPTARNGFPPPVAGDAAVPAPPPRSLPGPPQPAPPVAATALPDPQWAAAAPPVPDATALPPGAGPEAWVPGPEAWVPAPEDWVTPPGGWAPPPGRTPAGGDPGAPWQPGPPATELPGGAWPNQPGRPPDVRRNSRSRLWLWIAAAVVVALALGAA